MSWNYQTALAMIAATVVPSFLLSLLTTALVRRKAEQWGLVDKPNEERKVHTEPTPLGGGIGIWAGLVGTLILAQLGVLILTQLDPASFSDNRFLSSLLGYASTHVDGFFSQLDKLWAIIFCATTLAVLGLVDDRLGISWKLRLGVQFGVAALVVFALDWKLSFFVELPMVTELITMIWIVGLINSFNMLDNMDGLSAGVATISCSMLAAVLLISPSEKEPQLFVAAFLLVLVGSLLGFLWHNRPPAKIFMGDAGSYLVGFSIAVMTILATFGGYHDGSQHAILAPLCVLAVPLYDMVTVLWIRLREGRSIFKADKCHFSHRLVELGFSKTQAVLTIYLMTATSGLGALILHRVDWIGAIFVLLMVACVLALIAVIESTARRHKNGTPD
ncbi:MAG: undecaprenyl-phosphate alpha-N-acetylglucosaminyl 1-phosphate transferase [Blastopirellula sp.]|nr:MAG: undecaprenyl-phosphate alpha-N-acetylglucosaminyl 1-phosphate transferase [Blastopirellula sp.]